MLFQYTACYPFYLYVRYWQSLIRAARKLLQTTMLATEPNAHLSAMLDSFVPVSRHRERDILHSKNAR
jgi:hypothetical protein